MAANALRIHPTALIDPVAELSDDVVIEPYAIIDGPVCLGPGCVVRARAHLMGTIVAGAGNDFGIGCPASRSSAGFGSSRSMCEGPPSRKRKMTDFALGIG